jgi:hypothetical protein
MAQSKVWQTIEEKIEEETLESITDRFADKIKHLDPSGSLIIRGHLLLEEQITLYLEKKLKHPEFVLGSGFKRKVQLFRALSPYGKEETFWKLVDLLNGLRNATAHQPHEKSSKVRIKTVHQILETVMKLSREINKGSTDEKQAVKKAMERELDTQLSGEALIRLGFAVAHFILGMFVTLAKKEV